MMLKITVKTLDSRNYQFEADDDWTVSRFKEHIQDTVNVPSNEQRLIFCGRVLQNDKKLTEYDCDGKVIHLVRRPPPSLDTPQASATIVVTSEAGLSGFHIPVSIPLAINAASHILSGVFGIQSDINQTAQQQNEAQPSQRIPSTIQVMMDIDIDDSSSSHPESSRYHDARDSVAASQAQTVTSRPLSSSHPARVQEQSPTSGHSGNTGASTPRVVYTREQIMQVLQNHPSWIPIIEADINYMEQQSRSIVNCPPYFSDAYLSSVPRKRRRLLTATPDRVLILHPSPSQAIVNLLRRAIVSSNLPTDPQDHLLTSIANDQDLQDAYEDYLKAAVEARLKTDYDYCPEKFENSSKYFK